MNGQLLLLLLLLASSRTEGTHIPALANSLLHNRGSDVHLWMPVAAAAANADG